MDTGRRRVVWSAVLVLALLLLIGTAAYAYTLSTQLLILRTQLSELGAKADKDHQDIVKLRADLDGLQARVGWNEVLAESQGSVDLTKTNFQPLEGGYGIAISGVTSHLSGVKISGQILNTQAVTHIQAKFKVKLGGQENEFTLSRIRPGYASKFSVYVPDVKAKDARFAKFEYQESTLSY